MKPSTSIAVLGLIVFFSFADLGESGNGFSGNTLQNICTDTREPIKFQNSAYCTGYIFGITSSIKFMADFKGNLTHTHEFSSFNPGKQSKEGFKNICIDLPLGYTAGQMEKIVKKWLNDHPEKLHLDAAALVIKAISEAFPCTN